MYMYTFCDLVCMICAHMQICNSYVHNVYIYIYVCMAYILPCAYDMYVYTYDLISYVHTICLCIPVIWYIV